MNVFRKLNTLLRAGARESAERVTNANAIRIYRQEIADAEHLLERRRLCLAGMIASRRDLEREIDGCEQRIARREAEVGGIPHERRSEEVLQLAARDIRATESHLVDLRRRLAALGGRIDNEELTLRKLRSEIREHRREVQLLASEVARGGCQVVERYRDTVAGHLATLRETREHISGGVAASDTAEAGMAEAIERVDGDPLERQLAREGLDDESRRLDAVLSRLRGLGAQ
ncbi:PspA/IM30 family protein [Parahaliea mediterranea]|uniref:PspA/IM30 family protein n=1 Tax=Parahaliea mediterranea TaxID=651086 RepID=A0A939DE68_9GAMM|nr:PspA/IM30 family protein [Parahaliea mediterranea]MBN7796598.1 PspA/IM30 family protein [Parahaliea mediterranea]